MRTTFMVGKVTSRGSEMVMVDSTPSTPIPGPWTLKALVRPAPPRITPGMSATLRVH